MLARPSSKSHATGPETSCPGSGGPRKGAAWRDGRNPFVRSVEMDRTLTLKGARRWVSLAEGTISTVAHKAGLSSDAVLAESRLGSVRVCRGAQDQASKPERRSLRRERRGCGQEPDRRPVRGDSATPNSTAVRPRRSSRCSPAGRDVRCRGCLTSRSPLGRRPSPIRARACRRQPEPAPTASPWSGREIGV